MSARIYKFPPECDERVYRIPSRDERPNLIDALAAENFQREAARHYRREARKAAWQRRVKWFCILTAYGAIVLFAFQLGRGVL